MKQFVRFLRLKYLGQRQNLLTLVYRVLFKEFGDRSKILGPIVVISPERISIGANSNVNEGCHLNGRGGIFIGDFVNISPGVMIHTGGLNYLSRLEKRKHTKAAVEIEDGVWIGAGAIINQGVTVGEHSVVGSGAVVTKNIPPNSVAVGVPARVIKSIPLS